MKIICILLLAIMGITELLALEGNKAVKVYTEDEVKLMVSKELEKVLKKLKTSKEIDLINEIMDKEKSIDLKEMELKRKTEEFTAYEREFTEKLKKREEEQKKIIGCIDENKRKEEERIHHLIQVISNMKPIKAAEILSVQELEIAVRVVDQLDPAKSSKIFNFMDKEISARIQKSYLNMKK